jgi:hypothetical protein
MLFPNWTGWKTVKLGLGLSATLVATLAAAGVVPANVAEIVATVDGALLSLVVTLSGTNAGPAMAVQRKVAP